MSEHSETDQATGAEHATIADLRLGPGFGAGERDMIVDVLGKLDRRLRRYEPGTVDIAISVDDRETPDQRVVLEVDVAKRRAGRLVATSTEPRIVDALREVREDMWRQLDEMIERAIEGRRG